MAYRFLILVYLFPLLYISEVLSMNEERLVSSIRNQNYDEALKLIKSPRIDPLAVTHGTSAVKELTSQLVQHLQRKMQNGIVDETVLQKQLQLFKFIVGKKVTSASSISDENFSLDYLMGAAEVDLDQSESTRNRQYQRKKQEIQALWLAYIDSLEESAFERHGNKTLLDYLKEKEAHPIIPKYFSNLQTKDPKKFNDMLNALNNATPYNLESLRKRYADRSDHFIAAFFFTFPSIIQRVKSLEELRAWTQTARSQKLIYDIGESFPKAFYELSGRDNVFKYSKVWKDMTSKLKGFGGFKDLNVKIQTRRIVQKKLGPRDREYKSLVQFEFGALNSKVTNRTSGLYFSVLTQAELDAAISAIRKNREIDFKRVDDGCYLRAAQITEMLDRMKIKNLKIFTIAEWNGQELIRVNWGSKNKFSHELDTLGSGNAVIQWWYHVAPVVAVRKSAQNITPDSSATTGQNEVVELYVIDLNLFPPGPVPLSTWVKEQLLLTGSKVKNIILEGRGVVYPEESADVFQGLMRENLPRVKDIQ